MYRDQDEGHYKRLVVVFLGPASPNRGLPACSESAPSVERRNSTPYSRFRCRASEEGGEDRREARSSFGPRPPVRRAPAVGRHSAAGGRGRASPTPPPGATTSGPHAKV